MNIYRVSVFSDPSPCRRLSVLVTGASASFALKHGVPYLERSLGGATLRSVSVIKISSVGARALMHGARPHPGSDRPERSPLDGRSMVRGADGAACSLCGRALDPRKRLEPTHKGYAHPHCAALEREAEGERWRQFIGRGRP